MRKFVVVAIAGITLVGASIAPAVAKKDERKGGRKAAGTITSFDGTTLSLTWTGDGSSWSGPVACDVKVKLEHRGRHSHGKGHGNPSNGTTDDLQAGAWVLKMKLKEGAVKKIRIRPAPATDTDETVEAVETVETEENTDDTSTTDTACADEDADATSDEDDSDEDDGDDDSEQEEDESDEEESEDADEESDDSDGRDGDDDEPTEIFVTG